MKLSVSTIIQMLVWLAAVLDYVLPLVPERHKAKVSIAAGIVSLTLHQYAGLRNPDGSNARLPWEPKSEWSKNVSQTDSRGN